MENKWISVQEALPEQDMPVWVTVKEPEGDVYVQEACYYCNKFEDTNGFGEYIDYNGRCYALSGVVAWMPIFVPGAYTEN